MSNGKCRISQVLGENKKNQRVLNQARKQRTGSTDRHTKMIKTKCRRVGDTK